MQSEMKIEQKWSRNKKVKCSRMLKIFIVVNDTR